MEKSEPIGITHLDSRKNTKKDKVSGAIEVIMEHLDFIYGRSDKSNQDPRTIEKWKGDIQKHINNALKEAKKTGKSVESLVKEFIDKGRFSADQIEQMVKELAEQGFTLP